MYTVQSCSSNRICNRRSAHGVEACHQVVFVVVVVVVFVVVVVLQCFAMYNYRAAAATADLLTELKRVTKV